MGCGARGMRWGRSPGGCRGDQGIVVVMTPYAIPIKEVSIQSAWLIARGWVLEGARLRIRFVPASFENTICSCVVSAELIFCPITPLFLQLFSALLSLFDVSNT